VRDPLGGINTLWPLFGVANQLLAAIALCLATTIILKMQLKREQPRLRYALVTFLPLLAVLAITLTAGMQKIFNADPRIGFLAQLEALQAKAPGLKNALASASGEAQEAAAKALKSNQIMQFNNWVNTAVAGILISLVTIIILLSLREWVLLIARKRLAQLSESEPVWLPAYELANEKPTRILGFFALAFALVKELSGESALERAQMETAKTCECSAEENYVAFTTRRFTGVNRCC